MASSESRAHVALWGCTGFTGRLIAEYLAAHGPERIPGFSLLLVGRSAEKVEEVKRRVESEWQRGGHLGTHCTALTCDTADQTRVVLCAAGPFIACATPIVDACVRLGVDYVDICGETPWVRGLIDKYSAAAKESKALIVNMCGFDSVPSDLGTWMMVQAVKQRFGCGTRQVRCYAEMNGSLSGGTINTGLTLELLGQEIQRIEKNPYALGGEPAGGPRSVDQDINAAVFSDELGKWTGPFMMAHINTRIVRRSSALHAADGQPYGQDFAYSEWAVAESEAAAKKLAAKIPPAAVRKQMVAKGMLPTPGQGPTKAQRDKSSFTFTFVAEAESGQTLRGRVSGGDPGYGETSKIVAEGALLLAAQRAVLPVQQGGFLTPAFAFGQLLIDRLRQSGLKFEIE